ncbi:MAG TPA: hypothetical protein PK720_02830 [bacterium]|nr:hypothetical protein [bacterium]
MVSKLKKLFTTPIYLFGEEKDGNLTRFETFFKIEEKEQFELYKNDDLGEIRWYDRIFSWPIFIVTWCIEILYDVFEGLPSLDIGQDKKPRKLTTALHPLMVLITGVLYFFLIILVFGLLFVGVIFFSGWLYILIKGNY